MHPYSATGQEPDARPASRTSGPAPKASVIVPHYRDLERLDACLAALSHQSFDDFEVIVADNNSPEGIEAVRDRVAGRGKVVVVTEPGAGPARNGGADHARGEILAFTDCDCVPAATWLEAGVRALQQCDFAGGAMEVLVADALAMTATEAFERVFAFDNEDYVLRKGFSVTANLFVPRRIFEQVGGFRVGVSEDLEWCLRARAGGFRLGYAPDALVGHPARRTWSELHRKWVRLNEEAFALALERPNGRTLWLIKALAIPLSAVAHAPKPFFSGALSSFKDRLGALWILFRLRLWRAGHALRLLKAAGSESFS